MANIWNAVAASDHNWNTGSNWSLGHAPIPGEIATFNATSAQDCTINSGANSCDGISITSLYAGTITANADLSLATIFGFLQSGGTFNLNSSTIHDMGNWTRSGPGTFNAGTGTIEFNLPSGIQTIDNGTSSLFNVLHSGAGTLELINNALNLAGLTTTAGTVNAFGQNVIITGLTTITDSTFTNSAAADTLTLGGGLSMTGGRLSSGLGKIVLNIGGNLTAISDATSASTISGTLVLDDSQQPFTINRGPQTTDLIIAATITDPGLGMHGGFRKLGVGILALTSTNSYSGGTIIDTGTVTVSANSALGPGTASTTIGSGTLLLLTGNVNYTTPETINIHGGTLASDAATTNTFSGPIILNSSSVPGIDAESGSTLHVTGATISMQGLNLTVGGAGNTIIDDVLIGGPTTSSLLKINSGMLTLNAANNYGSGSVGTTVTGGSLAVGNDSAIGSGLLTMNDGTTLEAAGGSHTLANNIMLNGATTVGGTNSLALNGTISGSSGFLLQTDVATLLLGGANSFGGVMVNAGSLALGTDTAAGIGTLAFNNAVSLLPANSARTLANAVNLGAGAKLTVTGTFDLILNGIISGPGAITHTSANMLTLNGANSFGGGLTMTGGTLSLGNDSALGTGSFALNDGTTIQAFGGTRTIANNGSFNNRVTITGSSNLMLNGVISSSGGTQQLTKVGSGTAIFTANNTSMSDAISVNAGSLYVNGQQPTPVTVNLGGVFGGSGTVGAITVNRGTLSPGTLSGPGTLSSGDVQFLNAGCTFSIQIAGAAAGGGYSQLNVTGTVNLGSGFVTLNLSGVYVPRPGNTFEIIANNGTNPISGTFVGLPDGATVPRNGVNMTIHYSGGDGNDVTLAVPPAKSSILGRALENGQWWLGASTGSSFSSMLWTTWSTGVTWVDVQTGDFNGDGHADIVGRSLQDGTWWLGLSNGSNGFTIVKWATWSTGVTWVDVKVADFDGDGKADITGRALETGQWWTTLTTSSTTFTTSMWASWSTAATWVDVKVGDFDGDGKADITGRYLQGGSWWTGISTGSSFNTSSWATWSTAATWVDVNVGDFNGDGKADIVGRSKADGSWWVGLSSGSDFSTRLWSVWSPNATWVDVKVGDFNGDGRDDIVGRYLEGGTWWVGLSNGTGFNTTQWAAWSAAATWVDVQVGDFNGDGKDDIAARYQEGGSWWTAISNGSMFTTTQWAVWSTAVTWVDVQSGRYL